MNFYLMKTKFDFKFVLPIFFAVTLISCSKDEMADEDSSEVSNNFSEPVHLEGSDLSKALYLRAYMSSSLGDTSYVDVVNGGPLARWYRDVNNHGVWSETVDIQGDYSTYQHSISALGGDVYHYTNANTPYTYTFETVSNTKNKVQIDYSYDGGSEVGYFVLESNYIDCRELLIAWDGGLPIPSSFWGGIGGACGLFALIEVVTLLTDHCSNVVQVGSSGCVSAGGLPQVGFCSVGCCPSTGCI